ncbi:MAG: hypothetical protein AB7N71_11790 [Phycisphaerae bacterium]
MNKTTVIYGIIAALVVVGGVYAYQAWLRPGNAATLNSICVAEGCEWKGSVTVRAGEPYPPKCPRCKKQTVTDLFTCRKCGNKQPMNQNLKGMLPEQYADLEDITRCTQCGEIIRH